MIFGRFSAIFNSNMNIIVIYACSRDTLDILCICETDTELLINGHHLFHLAWHISWFLNYSHQYR